MKLKILAPGPLKFDFVKTGLEYYVKRIKPFVRVETLFPKTGKSFKEPKIRKKEEAKVLAKFLKDSSFLVVLDERGKELKSREFAKTLENWLFLYKEIVFLVGGPEGVDESLKNKADFIFSLSKLTLNHEIALLVLAEAIYRAFSIIKGTPYHRE